MIKDIFAALTFFTRLPFGRILQIPADSYKRIVAYWPIAGWLTGGTMFGVFWFAQKIQLPIILSILLALSARLLLTGALHEDGLSDFFDGFGGGHSREKVLSIMKDSNIGSYGVIGIVIYFAIWISSMYYLAYSGHFIVFFICDVWSKWCASQIVNFLPYARKEEDSKIKKIYERMSQSEFVTGLLFAAIPLIIYALFSGKTYFLIAAAAPFIVMLILIRYIKYRIDGYTGDCCGAMFLLCELSYLLTLNCIWIFF